jgi:hypothetical protein
MCEDDGKCYVLFATFDKKELAMYFFKVINYLRKENKNLEVLFVCLFVFLILKGSIPVKQICKSEFPYYSHLNC